MKNIDSKESKTKLFNPIISGEIITPQELLTKLDLRFDGMIPDKITWNEFEDEFPDNWTYSLDEITHLIDEGIYVYICRFDDGVIRYVEDQDYCDDKEPLFDKDFEFNISYEQDTNTLVINSDNNTGVRYYLEEKSDLQLRIQNYIDFVIFENKGDE